MKIKLNANEEELKNLWEELKAFLTPKEQKIVAMRLGLVKKRKTLDEVGKKFGISRERTRQIIFIAYQRAKDRHKALSST